MIKASQKLAALMFTDIVGYSRLMGENEASTVDLVQIYRNNLTRAIVGNHGEVREFIGDGLFASFTNGLDAARAGIQIQLFLHEFNQTEERRGKPTLRARVGIHMGEVYEVDGQFFGDDVNIAARLEPLAEPGAICVSQVVFDQLAGDEKVEIVPLGPQRLKNIKRVCECYQLLPQAVTWRQRLRLAKRYVVSQLMARPRRTLSAAAVLLLLTAYWGVTEWQSRQIPEGYYLEVVDFIDTDNEKGGTSYLSEGITDAVRAQLAGIDKLYLVRTDERIGAPLRLEGNVLKKEGHIRVNYRITRKKDGILVGGKTHDGVPENIFGLQDKLASSIARNLAAYFRFSDVQLSQANFTSDITAYDYYLQGRGWLRQGITASFLEKAAGFFKTALKHDPGFARAQAGLCGVHVQLFEISRNKDWINSAEENCRDALSLERARAETHVVLGDLYRRTGRLDESIQSYKKAISLDPKQSDAYSGLARAYEQHGDYPSAEASYRKAIEIQPGYWGHYDRYAGYYVVRGKFKSALQLYRRALGLTPENAHLLSNVGGVYLYRGEFARASEMLKKSVALLPTARGYSNTGTAFYFSGQYGKAAEYFEKAIALAPGDYRLHNNLADALYYSGNLEAATEKYGIARKLVQGYLKTNPKDVEARSILAKISASLGDYTRANREIGIALKSAPRDIDVLLRNAIVRLAMGDLESVYQSLRRIINAGYTPALLAADPVFEELRQTAEFRQLLE
ncbi:MAG: tetratricopeptide repeat protein [Gammaproteobacteria bacterium]|nr:tetratricopeptide repeat protein [Gammaproteobacteria bacterium]